VEHPTHGILFDDQDHTDGGHAKSRTSSYYPLAVRRLSKSPEELIDARSDDSNFLVHFGEGALDPEDCVGEHCGSTFFFIAAMSSLVLLPVTGWMWWSNIKPSKEYLAKKSRFSRYFSFVRE